MHVRAKSTLTTKLEVAWFGHDASERAHLYCAVEVSTWLPPGVGFADEQVLSVSLLPL